MAQEYARIFAALDGASTQEAVAQRAVTLAADNHAKLMFGHVIDSVPYEASGVDFEALCAEGKSASKPTWPTCWLRRARTRTFRPWKCLCTRGASPTRWSTS